MKYKGREISTLGFKKPLKENEIDPTEKIRVDKLINQLRKSVDKVLHHINKKDGE